MHRIHVFIAALVIALLAMPVIAQVETDGTPQGDGIASAGKCTLSKAAIFVVGNNDTQGSLHVKCGSAGNTRVAHVLQVEIMADGTRRVFQDTQFDWGGNKSPNKDLLTAVNTSCGAGSGQYALDLVMIGPKATDTELGVSVTLPVSGCN